MDLRTELQRVNQELVKVNEPLLELKKQLLEKIEKEEIELRKENYKTNIEGKIYYGDGTTWHGYEKLIYIVKPLSCDDWSYYNCCNVIQLTINLANNEMTSLSIKKDELRVDMFATHYKLMTPEYLQKVKTFLDAEIVKTLNYFV